MREAVAFPDATAVICEYLRDVTGKTTGNKVPNPRLDEFYVVQRVGGVRRSIVLDDATLVVEAWALTDQAAMDLAELARAHLSAICGDFVGAELVYRVTEGGGVGNLPDPLSNHSRVTFTVVATVRGAALTP